MGDSPAGDEYTPGSDVALAWSYAINADLGLDPRTAAGQAARERAIRARSGRHARYARDLLCGMGADPDRLAALAGACRARHARDVARGLPAEGGHATAAHLADLALGLLRQAEGEAGPGGRDKLIAELAAERAWTPGPYRQGFWHRHSRPRRLARRASPAWWYRRRQARLAVTAGYDSGYQQRTFMIGSQDIGHVVFGVCHRCQVGCIGKISVCKPCQGRGIASRRWPACAPRHRATGGPPPGSTPTARTFWRRISRRAGGGYEAGRPCEHIEPAGSRPGQAKASGT